MTDLGWAMFAGLSICLVAFGFFGFLKSLKISRLERRVESLERESEFRNYV